MAAGPGLTGVSTTMGLTLPTIGESIGSWEPKIISDLNIIDGQLGPLHLDYKVVPFEATTAQGGAGALFQPSGVANQIAITPFYLNRYFNLKKILLEVGATGDAGKFAYCGIYNVSGNLIAYAKFSVTTPSVVLQGLVNVTVLLRPGVYYACIGSDSLIATGGTPTGFWDTGLSAILCARAGNLIAGAVMPATLGVLTPNILGTMPSFVLLAQ